MSAQIVEMGRYKIDKGEITHCYHTRYMNVLHACDHEVQFRRMPITPSMSMEPDRIRRVLEEMGVIQEGLKVIAVPEEDFFQLVDEGTGEVCFYIVLPKDG